MIVERRIHGLSDAGGPIAPAMPAGTMKRRFAAFGAAFAAVCAGLVFFGPQMSGVVAGDDAGIRAFLRESGRPASPYQAPAWRSLQPAPVHAYAPTHHRLPAMDAPRAIDRNAPMIEGQQRGKDSARPLATAAKGGLQRRSVCVRLCDGFHFPVGNLASDRDRPAHEAQCASLCPGAPTRLFVMGSGSEKIDEAVSRDGKPYAALPVAFRHTQTRDATCSCGPRKEGGIAALLQDITLRRGDSVMTDKGMRVFEGARTARTRATDFVGLSRAKSLSREQRTVLASLERASRRGPPLSASTIFQPLDAPPAAQANLAGRKMGAARTTPAFVILN